MGFFLSSIIRAGGAMGRQAFARDVRHPGQTQKIFCSVCSRKIKTPGTGKNTFFHRYEAKRISEATLPVVEYEDIEPYIEQIKKGSRNVLTSEPVSLFNMTSGTTARPKYIPLTPQGLKRAGSLMRQWFYHALTDHPSLLDKGFLSITGAAIEGRCESGIPYGSASGMISNSLPSLVRRSMAVPAPAAEIADYDIRYYVWARLGIRDAPLVHCYSQSTYPRKACGNRGSAPGGDHTISAQRVAVRFLSDQAKLCQLRHSRVQFFQGSGRTGRGPHSSKTCSQKQGSCCLAIVGPISRLSGAGSEAVSDFMPSRFRNIMAMLR